MLTIDSISALRQQLNHWRQQGNSIAFVPTMGNLHAGHLALVEQARLRADKVVVSIFVNPLQFGPNEDFEHYPRTLEDDAAKLKSAAADLLFTPKVEEIYPAGHEQATRVEVPGVSQGLCGEQRPGHFTGVATVVAKLFNLVQPDVALFGEKDYQQLLVIRRMVVDLCFPIEVIGVATERDSDGLAMSSRNGYLSQAERQIAPKLYQALKQAADKLKQGRIDFTVLEQEGIEVLKSAGFEPEYFAIRDAATLLTPSPDTSGVVILAAAKLGQTRLIDNLGQLLLK